MEILLIGLSHHSAPLEVRERLWFPGNALPASLQRLRDNPALAESVLLSTCNRTEIVAVAPDRKAAFAALLEFLDAEKGFPAADAERYLYRFAGRDAVRHLFRVSASLDSMIIGEPQILGQLKQAYAAGRDAATVGPILDQMLRRALSAGKHVRSDTGIARNPVSISYAAARLARQIFGSLSDRSILLIGSGKMSDLAARHLIGDGVANVWIANRTYEKAVRMAQRCGGSPIPFDRFFEHLIRADVVVASTSAPHWILKREDVARLMPQRRNRPVFLIDIAVPRDIEPAVNQIDNVYLYDIDDLQSVVDSNREARHQETEHAEEILEREVASFVAWFLSRDLSPTIVAFRGRLHDIRGREWRKFRKRLGPLSRQQEEVIGEMTTAIVNKILHHPIRWLKKSAGAPGALRSAGLVKDLFDLPRDEESDREPVNGDEKENESK